MSEEYKVKCVKIERFEQINGQLKKFGNYIVSPGDEGALLDEINESENGHWTAQIVWMTPEQLEAMPDFEGF